VKDKEKKPNCTNFKMLHRNIPLHERNVDNCARVKSKFVLLLVFQSIFRTS